MRRKKVKIGDIFPVVTSKGICYGQLINTNKTYGYIVAIFREFFEETPTDFTTIVSKEPQLITCFVFQTAVNVGLFTVIDNVPVAPHLQEFPIFRTTNNLKMGEDAVWWFWDGDQQWRIRRPLAEVEKKYPAGPAFPSAPLLIQYVRDDYRVERDYI